MLGYSAIDLKVCQESVVRRKKSSMTMYQRISCLFDNLNTTWQSVKEPTNKLEKNTVAVVRSNPHCEKEMVGAVQQKSP